MDNADRQALSQARHRLLAYLQKTFAEFTWRMPAVQREALVHTNREELVVSLEYGIVEREAKHWDFAFTLTDADLISHDKPYALGPLRVLGVAVTSTARLDPQATQTTAPTEERRASIANRIEVWWHAFRHGGARDFKARTLVSLDCLTIGR